MQRAAEEVRTWNAKHSGKSKMVCLLALLKLQLVYVLGRQLLFSEVTMYLQ